MSICLVKKRSVVLPKRILEQLCIREGQKLELKAGQGKITLTPIQALDGATKRILARIKKGYHLGKFKVPLSREGLYR